MSETTEAPVCAEDPPCAAPQHCDCPPPAERASTPDVDPRRDLLRMAAELMRTRDARLLADYLRLRRSIRA